MLEINENYIEKKWERAIDLLEMDQISRKKTDPFDYNESLYKNGQGFLNIQYSFLSLVKKYNTEG